MRSFSTTLLFLGLCVVAAPSLRASICTDSSTTTCFNNGSGGGDTLGIIPDPLTFGIVTASAWATDGSPSNTFRDAALEQYLGYGLGVCAQNGIANCGNTAQHAIDNSKGSGIFDFVLLQFSVPVTSVSFTLNPFDVNDQHMDYTYFAGSCTAAPCSPSGKTLTTLSSVSGLGGLTTTTSPDESVTSGHFPTHSVTVNLGNSSGINWLLIGASTSGTLDDFFKLESVSYTNAVPEPATFGLAGAALAALGLLRRRKTLSANN